MAPNTLSISLHALRDLPHRVALIAAFILLLATAGCRETPREKPAEKAGGESWIIATDALGEQVKLSRPAERVISLAPNITESIFAIGAGDMLVGRTSFCNAPLEALRVETVSDLQTPDYEKVVARRPDLVLMTFAGNISTNYHKLRDLGLQVYVIHDSTIAGSINAIDTIGTFLGKKEEAGRLTTRLRGTIDSISALARGTTPVTTFIVIDKVPLITASKGFIDEAIRLAGGENIAAGGSIAYPQYAREELLRKDPEVIIVPALSWKDVDDLIAAYPEWKRLRAVRNNRVYALPVEIISRPGPRIGEAVTLLYQALHGADPKQISRF